MVWSVYAHVSESCLIAHASYHVYVYQTAIYNGVIDHEQIKWNEMNWIYYAIFVHI